MNNMVQFRFVPKKRCTKFLYPLLVSQKNVFSHVHAMVGDALTPDGIPVAQEVEGWSELCSIGDCYELDDFNIECVE